MDYIIGIDIGTSGTKALAYTTEGQVKADHHVSYSLNQPNPGWADEDPGTILKAVVGCLRAVVEKAGSAPVGVCFSAAMHGLMAVDHSGIPLGPLITWADTRSREEAAALKHHEKAGELYGKTGTPIHPMTPICKLMWLNKHQPELVKRTHKFISIKEYIFYQFFGEYIIDHSLASATGLFDIRKKDWLDLALEIAGIERQKLSKPVSPGFVIRGLKNGFDHQTGLPAKTPFVVGASDGCLANLGTGAMNAGQMAVTVGTSGAVRVAGTSPLEDLGQRIFSYILWDQVYISGGPVNSGGVVLEWFNKQFRPGLSVDQAISEAMKVPAGAEGLICLPYIQGERAPVWDGRASGVFFGISIQHTAAHFTRSVLEGICYNICVVQRLLEQLDLPAREILLSGGIIQSRPWAQLMADILDRKIVITNLEDASATGAAMLGLVALQELGSLKETGKLVKPIAVLEPHPAAIYEGHLKVFCELYGKLKSEFQRSGSH